MIKYLIVNIGVLVLSDLAITILSEKNDRVSHWKTQYDALSISYKDLKDRNKSLIHLFLGIIEKSEFKTSSKKSEVITEIHKLLENNFKEHIENTDLDIIVGRCQTIKELVSQTQVSRMFDNIDIMNKNTL